MNKDYIVVIGGGLAGSEAALQIAKRNIKVKLYEMKPVKFSPAHSNSNFAEIVCSNSFKSNLLTNNNMKCLSLDGLKTTILSYILITITLMVIKVTLMTEVLIIIIALITI